MSVHFLKRIVRPNKRLIHQYSQTYYPDYRALSYMLNDREIDTSPCRGKLVLFEPKYGLDGSPSDGGVKGYYGERHFGQRGIEWLEKNQDLIPDEVSGIIYSPATVWSMLVPLGPNYDYMPALDKNAKTGRWEFYLVVGVHLPLGKLLHCDTWRFCPDSSR